MINKTTPLSFIPLTWAQHPDFPIKGAGRTFQEGVASRDFPQEPERGSKSMGVRTSSRADHCQQPQMQPCVTSPSWPGAKLSAAPTCGNQSSRPAWPQPACGQGVPVAVQQLPLQPHAQPTCGRGVHREPLHFPPLQPVSSRGLCPPGVQASDAHPRLPLSVDCMLPACSPAACHLPPDNREVPVWLHQPTPALWGQTTAFPVGSEPVPRSLFLSTLMVTPCTVTNSCVKLLC